MAKPEEKTLPVGTITITPFDDEKTRLAGASPAKASAPEKTQAVLPKGMVHSPTTGRSSSSVEVFKDAEGIHVVYPSDPMQAPVCGMLLVVSGPGRGMAVPISYGRNSVGSGEQARLRLDLGDPQMSSVHCIVSYDHEDRVFDVREADGATNFTRVNGGRIGSSHILNTGDILKLGGTELRFVEICGPSWDWADNPVAAS
ncbi:FHA domain-containing protein [Brevundimonas lenta]|uniref:FHA domain-containing protein n=1 Tax=Brevundimonas lenta TaxID=424796 RepID=A0A7W6NNR3_9CAUL|nr:FHA domain-containing protein [Brevundimonas lenta]MBB4081422.1 hypothetical protein [Brevundimonas lenta]